MTDSAISAAVIPSNDAASDDDLGYDNYDTVEDTRRDRGSASLSHSLAISQADYVKFPGFPSTRYHQQDLAGHHPPRTPLDSATKWLKSRWPKRSRSVDSLEHLPSSDVHGAQLQTKPHGDSLRMYRPPTREQQREARSARATNRSRGRDEDSGSQQNTTNFSVSIPVLRREDNTEHDDSPRDGTPRPYPQTSTTPPQVDWLLGQDPSDSQHRPAPIVPQTSAGPPHASTPASGVNTMTTQTVTQTNQSAETRYPDTRAIWDPTEDLNALFGDTVQPPPPRGTITQLRLGENDQSSPRRTTHREEQVPRSLQGEGPQNFRPLVSHEAQVSPRLPTGVSFTQVGDDIRHQESIRDRNQRLLGFSFTPGDEWDHTNLDLIGNSATQDHRAVQRQTRQQGSAPHRTRKSGTPEWPP